ncbi:MAG: hypothetical protein CL920_39270 [Deltaproteobacteria bacterium]|nr:hypothetical protein [Deltaproteobacteria bacterium]MBU54777.1 hypothetical protein [Deltaproteobacteria bacterium]
MPSRTPPLFVCVVVFKLKSVCVCRWGGWLTFFWLTFVFLWSFCCTYHRPTMNDWSELLMSWIYHPIFTRQRE